MSALNIYERLRSYGFSHAGACAMLGNFEAESALQSNNLQNDHEKKLGFTDAMYTMCIDAGEYKNFANDKAGYGLAQWTYGPRKKNLLDYANKRNVSIGDENMQIDFTVHELRTEYPGLFEYLCSATELYEATSCICKEYERPAVNNIAARYEYALKWDKQFRGEEESPKKTQAENSGSLWFPPDLSILILQSVLVGNGYNTDITGYKNAHFLEKLEEFVHDIGE